MTRVLNVQITIVVVFVVVVIIVVFIVFVFFLIQDPAFSRKTPEERNLDGIFFSPF